MGQTVPCTQLLTRLGGVAVAAQVQHQLAPVCQSLGLHGAWQHPPPLCNALARHPLVLLIGQEHLRHMGGAGRDAVGRDTREAARDRAHVYAMPAGFRWRLCMPAALQ